MKFAVYVPQNAGSQRSVDVVVYVDGRPETCPPAAQDPEDLIKNRPFSLGKVFDDQNTDAVLVAPLLPDWKRSDVLGNPSALERVVVEALNRFGQSGKPPAVSRLILAGHSGAYRFLDTVAKNFNSPEMKRDPLAKITKIWGFDTSYSCPNKAWIQWLKSNAALTLRVFYVNGSKDTSGCGEEFGRLSRSPDIDRRVVAKAVDEGHCEMVGKRLPDLLASLKAGGSNPEFELEQESPSPLLARVCAISASIAKQTRNALRGLPGNAAPWRAEAIKARAAEQINRLSRQLLPRLGQLRGEEVDLLTGCLGRVEHSIGRETLPMRRFRAAARARMVQLGAGIR